VSVSPSGSMVGVDTRLSESEMGMNSKMEIMALGSLLL
jgi:hypothetical protein